MTGVQTCALPIWGGRENPSAPGRGPDHSWGGWGAEEAPPQMQECSSKGPLDGSLRGLPLCGLQTTPAPSPPPGSPPACTTLLVTPRGTHHSPPSSKPTFPEMFHELGPPAMGGLGDGHPVKEHDLPGGRTWAGHWVNPRPGCQSSAHEPVGGMDTGRCHRVQGRRPQIGRAHV